MVLKFTREQMMASLIDDADFAEWYVEDFMKKHLQNYYFEISDEGKREMVINGRNYARKFGFQNPENQIYFVTFMWNVAANFWQFPGFRDVLARTGLTEAEKIEALYKIPSEQAVDAIMNPDERYWYPEMIEHLKERYPQELKF